MHPARAAAFQLLWASMWNTNLLRRRTLLSGTFAAGLTAACSTRKAAITHPEAMSPGGVLGFKVIENEWIPMADGVFLSARLWLPEGAGKSPAVLECIPYRKRDLYRAYDDIWGAKLAGAGIAFVRVDVRGTGDSEGALTDEYSEIELDDCVELIGWIASQPWCTGAVGMRGLSWGGINTLAVAARQPRGLAAIVAMGCTDNRYTDDAHYIGGALGRANFQWGTLFKGVMAGPPDPAIVGDRWRAMWQQRLNATPSILTEWLRRQREDDYWRRGSVSVDYSRIKTPAYLVSGWGDTYAVPVLRLLEKMTAPAKALIGPWGHTYPHLARPQGVDWGFEEVRWWKHWLSRETNGVMDGPRLHCFMPYATSSEAGAAPMPGRWIAESHWPQRYAGRQFYLNSGALGSESARGVSIVHRDKGVVGATKQEWLDRPPAEQSHDDARSTVFDSGALKEPLEMLGGPRLRLSFSCDKPVANMALRLCEVLPDGRSWLVTWAVINLNRHNAMSSPRELGAGVDEIIVDLRPIAHRFRAGSRIRLSLSEGWWPMVWPSPETPTFRIASGISTLEIPFRIPETTPVELPISEIIGEGAPADPTLPVQADANGVIRIHASAPTSVRRIDDIDMTLGSRREETCEIVEGDPLSSRWSQTVVSSWRRGDWACTVKASYELACDAAAFRIRESLQAVANGEEVMTVANEARIPRDHL